MGKLEKKKAAFTFVLCLLLSLSLPSAYSLQPCSHFFSLQPVALTL